MSTDNQKKQRVWFITGASTGFGKELAKIVVNHGDVAVATFRKAEQVDEFNAAGEANQLGVLLDVTQQAQIDAGVEAAVARYGRIDVLVNNAGYGSMGAMEEVPDQEMRYQFEVNVFGVVNMTRAVLPVMRKQRSGNILNITSIAGIQGYPGVSIYNGSKFALEGIGEALAGEVAHLGIYVTNVEPGPFRTDWAGRSATYTASTIDDYADSAAKRMELIQDNSGKQVGDPIRAAEAMYQVANLEKPPVHLLLGGPAHDAARKKLNRHLEEIDAFEYLGRPTDYSEEELAKLDGK